MVADRSHLVEHLQHRLLSSAGATGWAYYTGRTYSRIEPTAWTLLALGSTWDRSRGSWAEFAKPHLTFLSGLQGPDGLLSDTEPGLVNFTTAAVAALVLSQFAPQVPSGVLSRLYEGLVGAKGVKIDAFDPKQDNQLQGWPWVRDTFSWVEPTAWGLLALKRADPSLRSGATAARAQEAEKLLVNRTCVAGGWNYGNASALGQDLRAYVPTTALGLLAMQDRRSEPNVEKSVQFLVQDRLNEASASTLSLTAICLRVLGLPADDVETRLAEAVVQSDTRGYLQAMAMACYALTADQHNLEAFRVRA
ncbi:MAG: hypothetical protein ABL982_00385 [Vicinamibacterales bacterium]